MKVNGENEAFDDLLKRDIEKLIAPSGWRILQLRLTPREIEVCDLIRGGSRAKISPVPYPYLLRQSRNIAITSLVLGWRHYFLCFSSRKGNHAPPRFILGE